MHLLIVKMRYFTLFIILYCAIFLAIHLYFRKIGEKLQLKNYIIKMVLFVLVLSFQILPTFMINIIILSTFLWYVFILFCLANRYSFYNFNICRNPMQSCAKVVKQFAVPPPPESLMFTKMIFKKMVIQINYPVFLQTASTRNVDHEYKSPSVGKIFYKFLCNVP